MIQNEVVNQELKKLISQAKLSLNEVKVVALSQAWKLLQLTVAGIIQNIEITNPSLAGKDKKTIAMDCLSRFYDGVFIVVDVPLIPNLFEPIIHKHVKTFLMILVGSTIDAMVTTFRQLGIFEINNDSGKVLSSGNTKKKNSTINKKRK